ncbi:aminotransferase class I/II-fold pyridoxal phosphate-dependent enzyme [bacterium]|nr:aminotransferase class I/II-fold pyridoxal phosphate-dependent enzyme [bacterium]
MLGEFRLEQFFARWEFEARYHLCASDAESRSLNDLLALADGADLEDWGQLWLGYIPSQGTPALRQAIAATYASINPDQVLCFCGAEEGLYCAMQALLGRDDHAIITVPNYQAMEELPLSLCGSVSGLTLRSQNQWDLDVDELRSLLRPNTRMVAVNFPNNPTGKVLSQQRWLQLIEIVREHNLWLFSDEVYRGLERNPVHTLPQAADLYPRALSLNVMSKAYGLPGLRVGWVACQDGDLLHRMGKVKDYLSICNSGPSEWLATIALKAGAQLLERNRQLARQNLERWNAFFQNHPELFQWWQPEGSCVAFPRYLGPDGVENWCQNLVQETGVLLLPASIYQSQLGSVDRDRFRLGYGRANLQPGLQKMGNFLCRQGRPPLLH